MLISGEAGVGKTALAETLCREAAEAGPRVLAGHCYDDTETPPYGPWFEIVEHFDTARALDAVPQDDELLVEEGSLDDERGPTPRQGARSDKARGRAAARRRRHRMREIIAAVKGQ